MPSDNVVERQWPGINAAIANKQIRSRGHMAATIGDAFEAGKPALSRRTRTPWRRSEGLAKRSPPAFGP